VQRLKCRYFMAGCNMSVPLLVGNGDNFDSLRRHRTRTIIAIAMHGQAVLLLI